MFSRFRIISFLFIIIFCSLFLFPSITYSQVHFFGFGYQTDVGNLGEDDWYYSFGLNLRYKIIPISLGKKVALGTIFDLNVGSGNYSTEENSEGVYLDGGIYITLFTPNVSPGIGLEYFFNHTDIDNYSGLKIPIEIEFYPSYLLFINVSIGIIPTFFLVNKKEFTLFFNISFRTYIMTVAY